MAMKVVVFTLLGAASLGAHALASESAVAERVAANPIRKVVTMLQNLVKKVEAEGEKEKELFEKYMCYCKTSGGDLEKSISSSTAKVPEVASQIKESDAQKSQLDDDLSAHSEDREAAKTAIAEATAVREKDAAAYAAKKAEYGSDVEALSNAIAALEKGMGGSFLQTNAADLVKRAVQSSEAMVSADREEVMAFLEGSQGSDYAPASGEIVGILKQLLDTMAAGLSEETATEEAAIKTFEQLVAAKTKEIQALTTSIEEKTVRVGELAVSIATMKNDLSDTEAALVEDQKFLADLKENCGGKEAEWDEISKTRSEELVALSETIKILNDDDALDLFKKALPSAASSFVQITTNSAAVRNRALTFIRAAQTSSRPDIDFIALALHGQNVGFEKVIKLIDDMVVLLKKEQQDDDKKKSYCEAEFDVTEDKKKVLDRKISDSQTAIADAQESLDTLTGEIEALTAGIKELDKLVAEATENRKEENEDYKELMAQNSAAKELLLFAKNRLNKFYNPKLYVPPTTEAPAEFVQVSAHVQSNEAPPPPPETFGAYSKKTGETTGVIAMMDLLVKDLDKEMTTAEADEKNAQAEYEKMTADSADKRAQDSKDMTEKEAAKSETEGALQTHKDDKAATEKELEGTLETIKALHTECDFLIQYFEARKEARTSEIDSLEKAKAVLSGADFSLIQRASRSLRGRA